MSLEVALRHDFGPLRLDLAFEAPAGVSALFGPSGSGKTSAINAVAGLLRPQEGRITFAGESLFDAGTGVFLPPHRRRIGYMFQDARLFPHLTVAQNLRFGTWFARQKPAAGEFQKVVELLDIAPLLARRPARLSGGEKARVALGRALLAKPRLLLMDEPLVALDEARKAEILPYLERLRDEARLPILYVSHSLAEVTRLADHLIVLHQGRVLAQGAVAEVLADHGAQSGLGVASAVITARFVAQEGGLSRYETQAGPIWLQGPSRGQSLKLRIQAQDVILAQNRPEGLSALNILPLRVIDWAERESGEVLVRLHLGEEILLSKITSRSAAGLGLHPGQALHGILKTSAL